MKITKILNIVAVIFISQNSVANHHSHLDWNSNKISNPDEIISTINKKELTDILKVVENSTQTKITFQTGVKIENGVKLINPKIQNELWNKFGLNIIASSITLLNDACDIDKKTCSTGKLEITADNLTLKPSDEMIKLFSLINKDIARYNPFFGDLKATLSWNEINKNGAMNPKINIQFFNQNLAHIKFETTLHQLNLNAINLIDELDKNAWKDWAKYNIKQLSLNFADNGAIKLAKDIFTVAQMITNENWMTLTETQKDEKFEIGAGEYMKIHLDELSNSTVNLAEIIHFLKEPHSINIEAEKIKTKNNLDNILLADDKLHSIAIYLNGKKIY